jgi:hypothetical protein
VTRPVIVAILGLVTGFFVGEALAVLIGITTNQLSGGAPPEIWILRSFPIVFAIAGAIATPILDIRHRSR